MRKIIIILVCILSLKIFSVSADDTSDPNINIPEEEVHIYAIYLNDFIELRTKSEWTPKEKKLLVLKDKTYMYTPDDPSVEAKNKDEKYYYEIVAGWFKEQKIFPDTFDDFWVKNQKPSSLNCVIPIKYEYIFITEELEIQTTGDNWENFYRQFPNAESRGVTTFSRVGFNKEKTQALLCVEFVAGPNYGKGHYILFEKLNNEWKEVGRYRCWIS